MASKHSITNPIAPITCHAWNGDRTLVAVSPNNTEVHIYSYDGSGFNKLHELKQHQSRVTGIDWAPRTNKIATAGEDRNAYVWNLDAASGEWKPTLVILRINRAATCVKWSPNELKFAVGSSDRLVSVCYFEEDNDWWVSKHMKKPIRSTVVSVDWHQNNVLLAVGSTDFKARVFGAHIKAVDPKAKDIEVTCWGKKMKFGECLAEFECGSWVHGIAFDCTGDKLAFVGHDSTVTMVDQASGAGPVRVSCPGLPFRCCEWVTPSTVVAAGHDNLPVAFTMTAPDAVSEGQPLDIPAKKDSTKRISAMDKFRSMDIKGTADMAKTATALKTVHQNSINELLIFAGDKSSCQKLCTVGVDGKLVLWDMAKLPAVK